MDGEIREIAMVSGGVAAVLVAPEGRTASRMTPDLVLVKLSDDTDLSPAFERLSDAAADERDSAIRLNARFDLRYRDSNEPAAATPYGTYHLDMSEKGETRILFSGAKGIADASFFVPRDMQKALVTLDAKGRRVAWSGDGRVLVVEADGTAHPELRLPGDVATINFLGDGPDLLVANFGPTALRWSRTEDGWQSRTFLTTTGQLVDLQSDLQGRWLLATFSQGVSYLTSQIIDAESGMPVRTLEQRYKGIFPWFSGPDEVQFFRWIVPWKYHIPEFDTYRAMALAALRPDCHVTDGNWRGSPCWPYRSAD